MDSATLGQRPAREGPSAAVAVRSPARRRVAQVRGMLAPQLLALAAVLCGTLALRLWGIKQGLPYSYNYDEATHFVPRAVAFFGHDLNPHYFANPPAFTYLLYGVFELWFGGADAVYRAFAAHPTELFLLARVLAAALGTAAVAIVYLTGARLFDRTVAVLAAAIFGLAFLPVFYSHLALNDVPALAPVALSLFGTAGVLRLGRASDYALAGAGVGLAAATKYTGGFVVLCLLGAFAGDAFRRGIRVPARRLALAAGLAVLAFVITNPYSILDFSAFRSGLSAQTSASAGQDVVKLGNTVGDGTAYYVWTFTWGLGWIPSLAAIAGGALLLVRRKLALALVLIPASVMFILFMGSQPRFFGRWLMPVFPIFALLAAYAAVSAVRWLVAARRMPPAPAWALGVALILAQSLFAVLHNDRVLARPDTRNLIRMWMVAHVPAGARVVIEPVVPDDWATDVGRALPGTPTGERWTRYPALQSDLGPDGRPLPLGQHRYVLVDEYERTLRPSLLDQYLKGGYCWVVLGSLQAGRAFAAPDAAPAATAYYAALSGRARLVYHLSPFAPRARPVPFSFDWSIDYYPRQYQLPGPEMSVYRLTGGLCSKSGIPPGSQAASRSAG